MKHKCEMLTFQPRFSKKVHMRDCPVVLPPHGPVKQQNEIKEPKVNMASTTHKVRNRHN